MLCNHCLITILLYHLSAMFNKYRKQITFIIWIILLNKI